MAVIIFYHNDADGIASASIIKTLEEELFKSDDTNNYAEVYKCKCGRLKGKEHLTEICPVCDKIVKKAQNLKIKLVPCMHGTKPIDTNIIDLKESNKIYILDYSLSSDEEIKKLSDFIKCAEENEVDYKQEIIFIDHHESSKKLCKLDYIGKTITDNGWLHTKNDISAAVMCYVFSYLIRSGLTKDDINNDILEKKLSELINTNSIPDWIMYVSDNDVFTNKYKNSKYFSLAISAYNKFKLFNSLSNQNTNYDDNEVNMPLLLDEGKAIYDYQTTLNEHVMRKSSFTCTITLDISREFIDPDNTLGLPEKIYEEGGFICCNGYGNSRVFGDSYDIFDGVILFSFNGENFEYNCFSKKEGGFPVNLLALYFRKIYGLNGGGHKHAAGWSAPDLLFKDGGEYVAVDDVTCNWYAGDHSMSMFDKAAEMAKK